MISHKESTILVMPGAVRKPHLPGLENGAVK